MGVRWQWLRWRKRLVWVAVAILLVAFVRSLPSRLFTRPLSTVLFAADGQLLSAVIADDGQWRFPERTDVPEKYAAALLCFEDRHFYDHNGVYLPAVARAVLQNFQRGEVVSGASTISMQVVRMSRRNPPRTWKEKALEMIRALRLEAAYSKEEILALYASHAPFGGNVVGIDAAAWRYFGRTPEQLSWAESATLAVLPNAPSLIHPGRNQDRLLEKRNRLLRALHDAGVIDAATLELSFLEPLPDKPYPLPQHAPHLLSTLYKKHGKGKRYTTTIDFALQDQVREALDRHIRILEQSHVHNAAVLVVEVKTGKVLAYVGNASDRLQRFSNMVDIIPARRSTGSILKPFLYAAMLQDGLVLPHTLVPDVPVQFEGFMPQNYAETFDGAVPADRALSRSLNIPAVLMLRDYGYPRFYHLLKKLHLRHLDRPADDYGLSLILGGGESSLWDLTHAYAGLSRSLVNWHSENGTYFTNAYEQGSAWSEEINFAAQDIERFPPFSAAAIWCTYNALLHVNRPESELGWEAYSSSAPIAWKTGTSFGNRDAWAIGTTPEYVVGVWVGNADGQGRPELTGALAASPLLFSVFQCLPSRSWFHPPHDELARIPVCRSSGMLPGQWCAETDTVLAPEAGLHSPVCSYHQAIHLDAAGMHRVTAECAPGGNWQTVPWFVLPPVQEYYYRSRHPEYVSLPPWLPGCLPNDHSPIGWIYPKQDARIYLPRSLGGGAEKVVLEATHRDPAATLYWHLGDRYLGETARIHTMEITAAPGSYVLTLVDEEGNSLSRTIEVIAR